MQTSTVNQNDTYPSGCSSREMKSLGPCGKLGWVFPKGVKSNFAYDGLFQLEN